MYLLFRHHGWDPETFINMSYWKRRIIHMFMEKQMNEMRDEAAE